jgi:hypothetical protein
MCVTYKIILYAIVCVFNVTYTQLSEFNIVLVFSFPVKCLIVLLSVGLLRNKIVSLGIYTWLIFHNFRHDSIRTPYLKIFFSVTLVMYYIDSNLLRQKFLIL